METKDGIGRENPCLPVHHYHIRKTAGTSLNAAFWALGGVDLRLIGRATCFEANGRIFVRHDAERIRKGGYFYSNAHLPAYRIALPSTTFTITILRDPVERILSHYRYLLWANGAGDHTSQEPFLASLAPELEWLGGSLEDFISRVPPCHLYHQLHMFSETFDVTEASERISMCSAVCFTETYSRDLQRLANALRLPLAEKHERRFGSSIELADDVLSRIRRKFAPEYELLTKVRRLLPR